MVDHELKLTHRAFGTGKWPEGLNEIQQYTLKS